MTTIPFRPPARAALALALLLAVAPACSIKRIALSKAADALGATGDVFASDDDPELVRDAVPFALKTLEALAVELPEHEGLLLAACRGFTQYAYAFVETDALLLEDEDWHAAEALRERALRLYVRAQEYGLRGLELRHRGLREQLIREPEAAAAALGPRELPLVFWTGAAWGAAVSLGRDRPELIADLPVVVALMRRALALDESFEAGAVHEVMIALESLPANMGGSRERARQHFERAVELSGGRRASPWVSYAESVAQPEQDRASFERLLGRALTVDPDADPSSRLQNLIVQRRARHLLSRVDALFLD